MPKPQEGEETPSTCGAQSCLEGWPQPTQIPGEFPNPRGSLATSLLRSLGGDRKVWGLQKWRKRRKGMGG